MTLVTYGGMGAANFGTPADLGGGGAGRTFADPVPTDRILIHGAITAVTYQASATESDPNQIKLKVFRPNGSHWDFVGESELFTMSNGVNTHTLSTPVTGVQPGDIVGVFETLDTSHGPYITESANGGSQILYSDADESGSNFAFTGAISPLNNIILHLEVFGDAPTAAMTGDSIEVGHGSTWTSFFDASGTELSGDPSCELGYQMRQIISGWNYVDFAKGSQTFAWVLSTGIPAILDGTGTHSASGYAPSEIWIHCGVNDVAAGRTWGQVSADLDAIYALCGSTPMFIDEILPDSNFDDAHALTVRAWNVNFANWASGKATVTIVSCHDALGQTRVSTDHLDDLKSDYDSGDGVHLNAAGAAALAQIRKTARNAYFGIGFNPAWAIGSNILIGAAA